MPVFYAGTSPDNASFYDFANGLSRLSSRKVGILFVSNPLSLMLEP